MKFTNCLFFAVIMQVAFIPLVQANDTLNKSTTAASYGSNEELAAELSQLPPLAKAIKNGDTAKCIKLCESYLTRPRMQSLYPKLHFILATCSKSAGNERAAQREFERAFQLRPSVLRYRLQVAKDFIAQNRSQEALGLLEEGIWFSRATPQETIQIYTLLGETHKSLSDFPKAREALQKAIDLGASEIAPYETLSEILVIQPDYPALENLARRAAPLFPDAPTIKTWLATSIVLNPGSDKSRLDEAVSILSDLSLTGMDQEQRLLLKTKAYLKQNNFLEAKNNLTALKSEFPKNIELSTLEQQLAVEIGASSSSAK